jgi:hypothetical protein
MKPFFFHPVLLAACLGALIGCGGTGGSDSSTTAPVASVHPDSWRAMAKNPSWDSAFHPRDFAVVWTGSEMIIWGPLTGSTSMTGGRYDPLTDSWTEVETANSPGPGPAVWTGGEMIIYTGSEARGYWSVPINSESTQPG